MISFLKKKTIIICYFSSFNLKKKNNSIGLSEHSSIVVQQLVLLIGSLMIEFQQNNLNKKNLLIDIEPQDNQINDLLLEYKQSISIYILSKLLSIGGCSWGSCLIQVNFYL